MDRIITDFRHAISSLRRQPTFLLAAVLTLTIGIGGTTAIYSLVNGVVFKPLPFRDSSELVRLRCPAGNGFFSRPDFLDLREQASSFMELASYVDYSLRGFDLTGHGSARRVVAMPISADYFSVLGIDPIVGKPRDRQDERGDARQVMISFELWSGYFQKAPDVVGKLPESV